MRNLILIGFGLAGLAASPAHAGNSLYGVQTLASLRTCGGASATEECPGSQRLRPFATDGGLWRATADSGYVETRAIPQQGSFGRGKGELAGGGLALPVLHAVSFAAASDARVNGSALGFTSYTYTGSAPTPFSLKGTLTVDDSFASPDNPLLPIISISPTARSISGRSCPATRRASLPMARPRRRRAAESSPSARRPSPVRAAR
jgi:hypothetical protein